MTEDATLTAPGPFRTMLAKFARPTRSGVVCDYCGWRGPKSAVVMSPKLNEDGAVYQITTCPHCMRNGGLEFLD